MTPEEKLLHIVQNAKGDDLERATRAFFSLSKEGLNLPHGHSGQTRHELLTQYQRERRDWEAAYALLLSYLSRPASTR